MCVLLRVHTRGADMRDIESVVDQLDRDTDSDNEHDNEIDSYLSE